MNTIIEFPISQICEGRFEVDLDGHWQEWGYGQKKNAVEFLENAFERGLEYEVFSEAEKTPGRGGRPRKIYLLTQEAAFKMLKNVQTGKMKEYRTKALDASAEAIARVENLSGPELASIAMKKLMDENTDLIEQKGILVYQIKALEPKAKSFDRFLSAENNRLLSLVAKDLSLKPNKLFRALREDGFLFQRHGSNVATQDMVNAGYFTHKTSTYTDSEGINHNKTQVMVTPCGQTWLAKRYGNRPDLTS